METSEHESAEQTPRESPSWGLHIHETKERMVKILPKVSQIQSLIAAIFAYDILVLKMCTTPRHPFVEYPSEEVEPIVLGFSP